MSVEQPATPERATPLPSLTFLVLPAVEQAGALARSGAEFGVRSLGHTKSTGVAISSLRGIAAQKAVHAWFGRGALSVGGRGIVGGAHALAGIEQAVALVTFGALLAVHVRLAARAEQMKVTGEQSGRDDTSI